MAIITQVVAAFDDKTVTFSVLVDDATGDLTGFRAVNAGVAPATGDIFLPSGARRASKSCLPGTDTTTTLPTTVNLRIRTTFDAARSRWVGFRGSFLGPEHPAVGG